MKKIKEILLNIFFPKFCLGCNREGNYLCEDCKAMLDVSQYQYCLCQKPKRVSGKGKCLKCQSKKLDGLYFTLSYQNSLIKELIQKFKYKPFVKELAKPLASLIITHFQLLDNKPNFSDFILIPIPLDEKRLRWRGFNQAEEIAKKLSKFLGIPLMLKCLIKIKETPPQVELSKKERKETVKGIFSSQKQEKIYRKKILLVDDIYTTGATMEEAAKVLKKAGAKQVWGVVVARE